MVGEIVFYQSEDGTIRLETRLENETLWLTQQQMAELFQTSKQNISHHIRSIYAEGELAAEATVKNYLTVQREGQRDVPLSPEVAPRGEFFDAADFRNKFPDGRIGSSPQLTTAEAGERFCKLAAEPLSDDYQCFLSS